MPIMIIAVLKLLVPTRPTSGRVGSMTPSICHRVTIFLPRPLMTRASNTMTATLANSEG